MKNMYMGSHSFCVLQKIWHTESTMDSSLFFKNNPCLPDLILRESAKTITRTSWALKVVIPVCMYELKTHASFIAHSFSHPIPNSAWCFSSVQTEFKVIISPVVWLSPWEGNWTERQIWDRVYTQSQKHLQRN